MLFTDAVPEASAFLPRGPIATGVVWIYKLINDIKGKKGEHLNKLPDTLPPNVIEPCEIKVFTAADVLSTMTKSVSSAPFVYFLGRYYF